MSLQIGISHSLSEDISVVHAAISRTLNFDPGDTDDLERIMANVSASMDGKPSARFFNFEGGPPVIVLSRPDAERILVFTSEDLLNDGMKEAVKVFGFNPETLQPCDEDEEGDEG